MTIALAVTGRPIAHSASPVLHKKGMASLGLSGSSVRIIADSASEALLIARKLGVKGLNVTAPFKEEISRLCDELSPEAARLSAVNTVVIEGQTASGFNTDVYGVAESLKPYSNSEQSAVVLGAGGAAKAACEALKTLKIKFAILNRSAHRAAELARFFGVESFTFSDFASEAIIVNSSIIVNCLSVLERPFKEGLIKKEHIVLDSHYKQQSKISEEAQKAGATIISGYSWLIKQSEESQKLFFGKTPDLGESIPVISPQSKSFALVGLMGSGKSQVGKALANKMGFNFVDLDERIESVCSKSIKSIFEQEGEAFFRKQESLSLRQIDQSVPHILSCGGGVILEPLNREFLAANYSVIWLWAENETLAARLSSSEHFSRPLLSNHSILDRLNELSEQRRELYSEVADLVIATDKRSEDQVMERLYEEIG